MKILFLSFLAVGALASEALAQVAVGPGAVKITKVDISGVKTPEYMINGGPQKRSKVGTWLEIDRTWKDGDRVEFSIDMPLRLIPLDAQHPDLVALLHGPIALFAIEPGEVKITKQQMLQASKAATSSDWQVMTAQGNLLMRPYPAITTEKYRLYQQT